MGVEYERSQGWPETSVPPATQQHGGAHPRLPLTPLRSPLPHSSQSCLPVSIQSSSDRADGSSLES